LHHIPKSIEEAISQEGSHKKERRLFMKVKWMDLLAGVALLAVLQFMGDRPAAAAPPVGEIKTVSPNIGNQVPIPFFEAAHSKIYMTLLYDPLVGCTPEGKFSPDLGLASKWEMSGDGLTWTFTLKKGVKFHDGSEVTAKDVKFSIEQVMLPNALSSYASFIRRAVQSVEMKDTYTVVIHCKKPEIFLLSWLSNMEGTDGLVVPKDYYERLGRDEFAKKPIGSGPYRWHSHQVGSFMKLEATEKHWRDGIPRYKYMTFLIIPEESTRLAMLKTGEADISPISREAVKDAQNAGLNVLHKGSDSIVVLHANMQWTSPVFSDVRFRKALNLAIDKEAIIKQLLAGLAEPVAGWPGSNISVVGGDTTLKPYPYNPQEARRLIKEGGWEGYEFALISYDRTGFPEFPKIIEAVAGYWEKVGLKPKIRISEWGMWRKTWEDRKTQNTVHGYDDTTNPDIASIYTKMMQKWYFKEVRCTVNIPELNERFERMTKSLDVAEISKLMAEVYRYAYDQHLMVTLCEISDLLVTAKRVPKWNLGRRRLDVNYFDLIRQ
jgi:peptide/nickel transport system substrate-binding protein